MVYYCCGSQPCASKMLATYEYPIRRFKICLEIDGVK